jgi:hypothetical protein
MITGLSQRQLPIIAGACIVRLKAGWVENNGFRSETQYVKLHLPTFMGEVGGGGEKIHR